MLNPLAGHIGYLLRRAQLIVFQDFLETIEKAGLTPAEYSALVVLYHYSGIRLNRLTEMLAVKPANCVALVNKLEAQGFVRRDKLPVSGRAAVLSLTDDGSELLAGLNPRVSGHLDRMAARLGAAETDQLAVLLERFIRAA